MSTTALRRATFDEVADLYDRVRPTYPAEVFDDLAAMAALRPGSRVAEVGCGSGQATRALLERGYRVTAVELGSNLAALTAHNLSGRGELEVVNSAFEEWRPPTAGFDAVVAFTSFHWVDAEIRHQRAASVLRARGCLGVVATHHVLTDEGGDFWNDVQADYAAAGFATMHLPHPDEVCGTGHEMTSSGLFTVIATRKHRWDAEYTADEYIDVLSTYSDHRMMDPEQRGDLHSRIRDRIGAQPGGRIHKSYLGVLTVARRND